LEYSTGLPVPDWRCEAYPDLFSLTIYPAFMVPMIPATTLISADILNISILIGSFYQEK
jgi:hypothetical protein